jgi:hypothetical protein
MDIVGRIAGVGLNEQRGTLRLRFVWCVQGFGNTSQERLQVKRFGDVRKIN